MAIPVAKVTDQWKVAIVSCMKSSVILSMFSYIAGQMVTIHLKFVTICTFFVHFVHFVFVHLAAQTYDLIVLRGQIEGQNLLFRPNIS